MKKYDFIDLHMHSNLSDEEGCNITIEEIFERALQSRTDKNAEIIISITDHNSTLSAKQADKILKHDVIGKYAKINYINGVEFTIDLVELNGLSESGSRFTRCHMLGYSFNESDIEMDTYSRITHIDGNFLTNVGQQIIAARKLFIDKYKLDIKFSELRFMLRFNPDYKQMYDKFVSFLAERANVSCFEIERLIGEVYVPYKDYNRQAVALGRLKLTEATKMIKEAGGYCVLAHPSRTTYNNKEISVLPAKEQLLENFIDKIQKLSDYSLDGIEAIYARGTNDGAADVLLELARKKGLFVTCGSDYHGETLFPNKAIGEVFSSAYDKATLSEDYDFYPEILKNKVTYLPFIDMLQGNKTQEQLEIQNIAFGSYSYDELKKFVMLNVEIKEKERALVLQLSQQELGRDSSKDDSIHLLDNIRRLNSVLDMFCDHLTSSRIQYKRKYKAFSRLNAFLEENLKYINNVNYKIKSDVDFAISHENEVLKIKDITTKIRAKARYFARKDKKIIEDYKKERSYYFKDKNIPFFALTKIGLEKET